MPAELGRGGLAGLSRFVVERLQQLGDNPGISAENLRSALSSCCSSAENGDGQGDIPQRTIARLMKAFQIGGADIDWFLKGDSTLFTTKLTELAPLCNPESVGGLRLAPRRPTHIWNAEFLSDVGPAQGYPMGLVLSVSGRPLVYDGTRWSYGFTRLSVTIEFEGTPEMRLVFDERTSLGYVNGEVEMLSRGVATRPEFQLSTLNQSAFDGHFISDILGIVTGAAEGDRIIARTRVERRDGTIAYVGETQPPSKTKQEIIACIFAHRIHNEAIPNKLGQFATLCSQEILVEKSKP